MFHLILNGLEKMINVGNRSVHPFYRPSSQETCNLLVDDDQTWKEFNRIKRHYQNLIDLERTKLDAIISRMNKIQRDGLNTLSDHMKGKQIYYWSNSDKKYYDVTLDQVSSVKTDMIRDVTFNYRLTLLFQLNGEKYSTYDLYQTTKSSMVEEAPNEYISKILQIYL